MIVTLPKVGKVNMEQEQEIFPRILIRWKWALFVLHKLVN